VLPTVVVSGKWVGSASDVGAANMPVVEAMAVSVSPTARLHHQGSSANLRSDHI